MRLSPVALALLVVGLLSFGSPAAAAGVDDLADQWLPRSDGATWTYRWADSQYQATPRKERYAIQSRAGTAFRLRWEELETGTGEVPATGTMDFRHTDAGLVNVNYQSSPPPPPFPVLCAAASECANSIAGTFYMLIWGTRSPVLAEPLVGGTRWSSLGGANNDVASANRYLGRERVTVPAFPQGIVAAKVQSDVTQAGAIGDPYGSGVRTVWWVRGVGPVKVVFRHAGGQLGTSELLETNLAPLPPPSEDALLPLNRGDTMDFRWRNSKHLKAWSTQRFTVEEVVNNTARVAVKHLKGPINVAGSYSFATRLTGVSHLQSLTKALTRVRFPPLGPRGRPADQRRRFFTPFDLMVYGFGPVVPVYAAPGETWRSSVDSSDFSTFGVLGRSTLVGVRPVKVPAGSYPRAVLVTSTLRQSGYRFGSGLRRMWFAPGTGLVRLEFRHGDGSISTVERLK